VSSGALLEAEGASGQQRMCPWGQRCWVLLPLCR